MNKKEDKEEPKKLVLWEGFRKELPWLLFWILLGVMTYGYYQDKQICDEVLANPCDACYKLNQTLIDSDYLLAPELTGDKERFNGGEGITYIDLLINDSLILTEDTNPNARTLSNY